MHCLRLYFVSLCSGPPSVPIFSHVNLSGHIGSSVRISVNWTLSGGDSADFYLVYITYRDWYSYHYPYFHRGRYNISTTSGRYNYSQRFIGGGEWSNFQKDFDSAIRVRGVNCGSQEGSESGYLRISLCKSLNIRHWVHKITNILYRQNHMAAFVSLHLAILIDIAKLKCVVVSSSNSLGYIKHVLCEVEEIKECVISLQKLPH